MKTFLNNTLPNPTRFWAKAVAEKKYSYAFFGYALGIISLYFAIKLNLEHSGTLAGFTALFFIWFTLNIVFNLSLAAVCNLFLELAGKKSSAEEIFILLGLSQYILALLIPCSLIIQAINPQTPWVAALFIFVFLGQIYFILAKVKSLYKIEKLTSLFALFGAFVLPFIIGFYLLLSAIGFIVVLFA